MIQYYKKTSFNDKVNVKKLYEDIWEYHVSTLYSDVKQFCNISDSIADDYGLYSLYAFSLLDDGINDEFFAQYQISFNDTFYDYMPNQMIFDIPSRYNSFKNTELKLIYYIIEIVKEGEAINE